MRKEIAILGIIFVLMVWVQVAWGGKELTLSVPPGWTPASPTDSSQKLHAFLSNEQGIVKAELIFAVEPFPQEMDLQEYFQDLSQNLQEFFQSYTPLETQAFTWQGLSGLRHKFLFQIQGNPSELQGLVFLFALEGQLYTLLFDALQVDFDSLEPQFLQIAQGLTVVDGVSTATPYQPTPAPAISPSQGLPGFDAEETSGGEETNEPSYWIYQSPQGKFRIPLPQGASFSQEIQDGSVYATPNQGQLVILVLEDQTAVQGIVAQAVQGKTFHGSSQLNTATGSPVQVTLYSSQNPDTNVQYATLVATFPGKTLLLLLVLPVEEYAKAQGWIEALFTGAEIQ